MEKKFVITERALNVLYECFVDCYDGVTASVLDSYVKNNVEELKEETKCSEDAE